MPRWRNQPSVLYHGTDSSVLPAGAISGLPVPFSVDLKLCSPGTDFGQGFYTTTNPHQAEQWANSRVLSTPFGSGLRATVLAFEVDRNWLASLDALTFVRPTADFWDLVTDCRHGFSPHGRSAPHLPPYDVVYGPVTLWPEKLWIAECDQISFHTARSLTGLKSVTLHAQATTYTFP